MTSLARDEISRDREALAVGGDGKLLAAALAVSLLVHLIAAGALFNQPLGKVDLSLLGQDNRPFRVYRSERDVVFEEELGDAQAIVSDAPDLSALSQALLALDHDAGSSAPPDVEMRDVEEERPELEDEPAGTPDINLADAIAQRLAAQPDLAIGYVPTPSESGTGAAAGTGAGQGTAGEGSARARRLLASAGLDPGAAAIAAQPRQPDLRGDTGPVDDRVLSAPLQPPPIDFADLALRGTTQLNVPEHLDDDFEYAVFTHVPQPERTLFGVKQPKDPRGYFRVDIRAKRSLRKLRTMPKDVVFIVDTSESITPPWIGSVIAGVKDGLATLNEGDRFNIVLFKENPAIFSPDGIAPFNQETLEKAMAFLDAAKSSGYTDVNRALTRLLVRDVAVERVHNLVLISDGNPTRGVMDTRELINVITRDNDLAAGIYCVGIGDRQNRELLDFLAYRNKGFCLFVDQPQQARTMLRDLFSRLRYPIMKDIRLEVAGIESQEIYPADLPNIHQGEQFSIYGRFVRPEQFTMRLSGHNGAQLLDFTFSRNLTDARSGDKEMMGQWAFWKLHHLYSEMIRLREDEAIRKQIKELKDDYKLKTVYD